MTPSTTSSASSVCTARRWSRSAVTLTAAIPLPIGIDGLADMYRLADRMLTLGYKQETVDGLFYDNAFNFMQKML